MDDKARSTENKSLDVNARDTRDKSLDLNENHVHELVAPASGEKEQKFRRVQLVVPEPKRLTSPSDSHKIDDVSKTRDMDSSLPAPGFVPYWPYQRLPWPLPVYPSIPGISAHAHMLHFPPYPGTSLPIPFLPDYFSQRNISSEYFEKLHSHLPRVPSSSLSPYSAMLFGQRSPLPHSQPSPEQKRDEGCSIKSDINTASEFSKETSPSHMSLLQNAPKTVYFDTLSTICTEKKKDKSVDAMKYQCSTCNRTYSTVSGLSKHKQFHCNQEKKEFSCKHCDKIYVSLGALKMHIRTHTLPCKCKLCGKAFSRPWLLQGHVRTHTGEKPFSCVHCLRAFADRSNLRAHLQTHSEVKKYSCRKCSKTFSRMSLLLKHEDSCARTMT
ncbi:SNAI2-like protein [Mya arenaria]|uniref:SNAI2-like protein n=1 Tax=Mya arenaria TaxID=6604 RepID=A0ABY7EUC3_MYAAR|nr:zinc finger protein SNAI2-like [Mya arenaria]WAR12406.1 SNAI2-like protein [Mya arenaria]